MVTLYSLCLVYMQKGDQNFIESQGMAKYHRPIYFQVYTVAKILPEYWIKFT